MYRLLVIALVLTVVSAKLDSFNKKCRKLKGTPIIYCCKSLKKQVEQGRAAQKEPRIVYNRTEVVKECSKIPPTNTCERLKCFVKRHGYISENGTVIKEVLEKMLETEFQGTPSFVEAVKENCFKGNIADLDGPPEMCELLKIFYCINRQAIDVCTEWDNIGICAGTEDLVKCLKTDA